VDKNIARDVAIVPATTASTAVVATPTVSQRADAARPRGRRDDDDDLVVGHVAASQR
jgi:hypothetical protein